MYTDSQQFAREGQGANELEHSPEAQFARTAWVLHVICASFGLSMRLPSLPALSLVLQPNLCSSLTFCHMCAPWHVDLQDHRRGFSGRGRTRCQ